MGKEKSPARGLRAEALGMGVTLQKRTPERDRGTNPQNAHSKPKR